MKWRSTALAEQALDRDGDGQRRIRLVRVQRGEQPRAARTEDQDIRIDVSHSEKIGSVPIFSPF
jgi:hypothetical protein